MRVLLLLRGSAGCGKSTWIEQNGLKITLCVPTTSECYVRALL